MRGMKTNVRGVRRQRTGGTDSAPKYAGKTILSGSTNKKQTILSAGLCRQLMRHQSQSDAILCVYC